MRPRRSTEIRLSAQLAAALDGDPRHPCEVIMDFFVLDAEERVHFMREYQAAQEWRKEDAVDKR